MGKKAVTNTISLIVVVLCGMFQIGLILYLNRVVARLIKKNYRYSEYIFTILHALNELPYEEEKSKIVRNALQFLEAESVKK